MSFARAVANVLKNEGGLSDDPNDPGGLTNFGISQRAYPALDIRNLTQAQAEAIYRTDYWAPVHGDELPDPVSFALLDCAVNSGVEGAVRCLQKGLRVKVDGVMGPQTIAACSHPGAVTVLSVERIFLLTSLPQWLSDCEGWCTRVIDTAIAAFQT